MALAIPMTTTGLLCSSPSIISTLFLAQLGETAFASGALAITFATITGNTVLAGLAAGMEHIPIRVRSTKRHSLYSLILQRTILLLLSTSMPIAILWLNLKGILLLMGQAHDIAQQAQTFILFLLPGLLIQSFLHPLRIYLQMQSMALPLTYCTIISLLLHIPINYLLVSVLGLGTRGVALGSVWTDFNLVVFLIIFISFSDDCKKSWARFSIECFKGWNSLLDRSIRSAVSVCLKGWMYEIVVFVFGLLNTEASMTGISIQRTVFPCIFTLSVNSNVSPQATNELTINGYRWAVIIRLGCSFFFRFLVLLFLVIVRKTWPFLHSKYRQFMLGPVVPDLGANRGLELTETSTERAGGREAAAEEEGTESPLFTVRTVLT